MSAPTPNVATAAILRLAELNQSYIDTARNSDAAQCHLEAETHANWSNVLTELGDVDGAAFHSDLAVLFIAHELLGLAATMIVEHDHDPLAES